MDDEYGYDERFDDEGYYKRNKVGRPKGTPKQNFTLRWPTADYRDMMVFITRQLEGPKSEYLLKEWRKKKSELEASGSWPPESKPSPKRQPTEKQYAACALSGMDPSIPTLYRDGTIYPGDEDV